MEAFLRLFSTVGRPPIKFLLVDHFKDEHDLHLPLPLLLQVILAQTLIGHEPVAPVDCVFDQEEPLLLKLLHLGIDALIVVDIFTSD